MNSRLRHTILLLGILVPARAFPAVGDKAPVYPDHQNLFVVRDARGVERPVRSKADWEIRRGHILVHLQEVMGPLPGDDRRVPLEMRVESVVEERLFVRKKIRFGSEPGDRVPAWLLIPKPIAGRKPAVLCLHQTVAIGKDEPVGLGDNKNLRYARELAERGYVALAPDYPGYGENKTDAYALGYASASMKAVWNNIRAVDLLGSLDEVDSSRMGVIGHSLGGHNAIFTALFDPRLKAVVSSCGFNSFRRYDEGNIAGWSHKGYMPRLREVYGLDLKRVPFDFPELIAALAPRGFFTNSPLQDENFEVQGVRDCLRAAAEVYELYGARDRLQADYPDVKHDFPPEERERAYRFLDGLLKHD